RLNLLCQPRRRAPVYGYAAVGWGGWRLVRPPSAVCAETMSGGQRDGVDRPTGEPRLGRAVGAFPCRRMRCAPMPCPAANAMALTALWESRGCVGRSAYFRPPLRCVPMPAPAVNAMALPPYRRVPPR